MQPERIQKILANAGLCSRREAEIWIEEGRVEVNGKVAEIGQSATKKDRITVNGAPVEFPEKIYAVMNKPKGFVTTMRGLKGQKTVQDLIPYEERVIPIGRLDRDTTGVLLFTNDGDFANKVMHPRYEIQKTYVAKLDKEFQKKDIAFFEKGIRLDEGIVRSKVRILGKRTIEIKLHQGFNHVVKRICEYAGYHVFELERTKVGDVQVDIPLGAVRELTEAEVKGLLSATPKPRPPQNSGSNERASERRKRPHSIQNLRRTAVNTSRNPGPRSR